MRFLVPQGIGDSTWALQKVQALAAAHNQTIIDIYVAGGGCGVPERRAVSFLRRFHFVRLADALPVSIMVSPEITGDYIWNYHPDGWDNQCGLDLYWLSPNTPLERGQRLESWLPAMETRWDLAKDFMFRLDELAYAKQLADQLGSFAVLYMSSELANSGGASHNRGPLWTPAQWIELGELLLKTGIQNLVVIGAYWDLSFWENQIKPHLPSPERWHSFIGQWEIGTSFAVIREARFLIGYQSGMGIFSTNLGVPTAMWWRPYGDSICPDRHLTFKEEMATAWVPPEVLASERYLPLIYTRQNAKEIVETIRARKW